MLLLLALNLALTPPPVTAPAPPATCTLEGKLTVVDAQGAPVPLEFAQVFLSEPERPFGELLRPSDEVQEIGQTTELFKRAFAPKFLVVQRDEVVRVTNSSSELHEVHCYSQFNVFDSDLTNKPTTWLQPFAELGTSLLQCHKHETMRAFVLTVPNRFHVAPSADGAFTLPGLPARTVEITLWQGSEKHRLQFSFARVRVDPCQRLEHTLVLGKELDFVPPYGRPQ